MLFCQIFLLIIALKYTYESESSKMKHNNNDLEIKLNDLLKTYQKMIKIPEVSIENEKSDSSNFNQSQKLFDRAENDFKNLFETKPTYDNFLEQDQPFTWTKYNILNSPPSERRGHSGVMADPYLIVFGGCYMDTKCYNDLYFLDTSSFTWSLSPTTGDIPSPRQGHGALLYGSRLWIFGGSSNLGFYNDLYSLDLKTRIWRKEVFEGTPPPSRANFGMIANNDGRIIIFGGISDVGYDNNIYILNIMSRRYEKPLTIGIPPSPRQSFGFSIYKKKLWVYGGFTESVVFNDLYSLEINNLLWSKVEVKGTIPPITVGNAITRVGNNLYSTGGCDKSSQKCFNDTYSLNLDTFEWSKLNNGLSALTPRKDFSQVYFRSHLLVFGGCELFKQCFSDTFKFNINEPCPLNCNGNGICKPGIGCFCNNPYMESDCSLFIKCQSDCNDRGQCNSNGECGCYPGFTGPMCDSTISCLNNCTGGLNGLCQPDSTCKCRSGYSGTACETKNDFNSVISYQNIIAKNFEKLNNQELLLNNRTLNESLVNATLSICKNNCSNNGECDVISKSCQCKAGYGDSDCSVQLGVTSDKKVLYVKKTIRIKKAVPPPKKVVFKEEKPKDTSEYYVMGKLDNTDSQDEKSQSGVGVNGSSTNTTGSNFKSKSSKKASKQKENNVKLYVKTNDCTNNCTNQGLCLNSSCFCQQGYSNYDCNMTYKQYSDQGYSMKDMIKTGLYAAGGSAAVALIIILII